MMRVNNAVKWGVVCKGKLIATSATRAMARITKRTYFPNVGKVVKLPEVIAVVPTR